MLGPGIVMTMHNPALQLGDPAGLTFRNQPQRRYLVLQRPVTGKRSHKLIGSNADLHKHSYAGASTVTVPDEPLNFKAPAST